MDQLSKGIVITIIATLFLVFVAVGIIILVLVYQKKQLQNKRDAEKRILESKLEAREQTFKLVSQELHDNIGQVLTLIKMNLNTIRNGRLEGIHPVLADSETLLAKVIQDLRDLSKALSTDFIHEIGFEKAVRQQLEALQKSGFYETRLIVSGEPYKLLPQHELVIFRILQELINNMVKHAEATEMTVAIQYEGEKLVVSVQDNGKGFDMQTVRVAEDTGLGLHNIQNRINLVRGSVRFESAPQKGCRVTIELPTTMPDDVNMGK